MMHHQSILTDIKRNSRFIDSNYQSYRESRISISPSAAVQAMVDISQAEDDKLNSNHRITGIQGEQLDEPIDYYADRLEVIALKECDSVNSVVLFHFFVAKCLICYFTKE